MVQESHHLWPARLHTDHVLLIDTVGLATVCCFPAHSLPSCSPLSGARIDRHFTIRRILVWAYEFEHEHSRQRPVTVSLPRYSDLDCVAVSINVDAAR